MTRITDKMAIFRDRMTAHRHMLTANNLPTKAFDEAISALHDALGALNEISNQMYSVQGVMPVELPAPKIERRHATFKPSAPREPCGADGCDPLPQPEAYDYAAQHSRDRANGSSDNWPEPTPADQDNFDGRFTDAAPGDTTY